VADPVPDSEEALAAAEPELADVMDAPLEEGVAAAEAESLSSPAVITRGNVPKYSAGSVVVIAISRPPVSVQ
jgi:hypothetical protein